MRNLRKEEIIMASIEKLSDNTYRITVSNGYNTKGQKLRERKTIEVDPKLTERQLKKELDQQAALFEQEVKTGSFIDSAKITFAEFVKRWERDYAEKELAPKTLSRYKELLDFRIIPAIGHIKLSRIKPNTLLQLYNNLSEPGMRLDGKVKIKPSLIELVKEKNLKKAEIANASKIGIRTISSVLAGNNANLDTAKSICEALDIKFDSNFEFIDRDAKLSSQTIKHCHRLISSILETACTWQVLGDNPATHLKAPKVEQKEMEIFDEETIAKMLECIESEPLSYKAAVYLALFMGFRLGELCALTWADIDENHSCIQVNKSAQYLTSKGTFIKETKNKSSERVVALPSFVLDVLMKYKKEQNEQRLRLGNLWVDNDYLFTKWNGELIFPGTISRWFKKFIVRHNLPVIRFHDLRHTNASILIANNVNVQTVAKRLGHSKATTTTSIYSHFLRKPDEEAAGKLDNLFNKNKKDAISKEA